MKKTTVIPSVLIAVVAVIAILGSGVLQKDAAPSPSTATQQMNEAKDPNTVIISNFAFANKALKVTKGTTVTWVNNDDAHHDITPDENYGAAFSGSTLLGMGESYSFTFNEPGMYSYHCSPHPYMKATIEVTL